MSRFSASSNAVSMDSTREKVTANIFRVLWLRGRGRCIQNTDKHKNCENVISFTCSVKIIGVMFLFSIMQFSYKVVTTQCILKYF